jgi:HK97 family phage prohead protease
MSEIIRKGLIPSEMFFVEGEHAAIFTISTSAIDRDHEIIEAMGIDFKEYMLNPVVLYGHDYKSLPIGRCESIVVNGNSLIGKVKFANTPEAEKVYQYLKDGNPLGASIGFSPIEYQDIDEEINGIKVCRRYSKVSLLEWSIVPIPANQESLLLAVKAAKIDEYKEEVPTTKKDFDLNNENWLNDPVAYEEDDILIMLEMINSDDSLLTHFNSKHPDVMKALKDKLTYEDKIESKYQKLASSIEELVELIKKSI